MSEWSKRRNYFYRIELLQRHATAPNPHVIFNIRSGKTFNELSFYNVGFILFITPLTQLVTLMILNYDVIRNLNGVMRKER